MVEINRPKLIEKDKEIGSESSKIGGKRNEDGG